MYSAVQKAFNPARLYDVLVIGGGNAAMCAAMTAQEAGAQVILLESAPRWFRGETAGTPATCGTCIPAPTAI